MSSMGPFATLGIEGLKPDDRPRILFSREPGTGETSLVAVTCDCFKSESLSEVTKRLVLL